MVGHAAPNGRWDWGTWETNSLVTPTCYGGRLGRHLCCGSLHDSQIANTSGSRYILNRKRDGRRVYLSEWVAESMRLGSARNIHARHGRGLATIRAGGQHLW